ncbi:MAG: nitrile hydratase subunit beta [Candidatus Rokuibacteriota bacterium]
MNGVHDLGGMHGLGPVVPEKDEPAFHHEWERRAFALTVATGFLGKWNLDMGRFAREQMPPAEYLATSYYEHWLWGLEKLLEDKGLVTRGEIDARVAGRSPAASAAARPPSGSLRVLDAANVERVLRHGRNARVATEVPARFRPGEHVVTRNINPPGHTRLPRYARGKRGVIAEDHGVWVFPDTHAAETGPKPQHCYSVRFAAREIWGSQAPERDRIYVDLFDDYLDPA